MSFGTQLQAFAVKAGIKTDLVFRKVGLDLHAACLRRSPVDTGRYRGSWRLSAGQSPDLSTAPEGEEVDPSEAAVKAAAVSVDIGSVAGCVVSNNLEYALPLEEGHSQTQAPNGVARLAAQEVEGDLLSGGIIV